MFEEKTLVTVIGKLQVINIGDEYIEMDPFEKGETEVTEVYEANGNNEVNDIFEPDKVQVGQFFSFGGEYEIVRSNDVFSKLKIGSVLVSIPNHKLQEVD